MADFAAMRRSLIERSASVGESCAEHLRAVLPFLLVTTGSRTIRDLCERMVALRRRPDRMPADCLLGTGI